MSGIIFCTFEPTGVLKEFEVAENVSIIEHTTEQQLMIMGMLGSRMSASPNNLKLFVDYGDSLMVDFASWLSILWPLPQEVSDFESFGSKIGASTVERAGRAHIKCKVREVCHAQFIQIFELCLGLVLLPCVEGSH